MKITLIFFLFIGFFAATLQAQTTANLFTTKELKRAYQAQSRDVSGNPGKSYWQNRTDYTIKAQLNPDKQQLSGWEQIKYTNNSPDSLKVLVFNLIQDIYKKGTARDWEIGTEDLHDGVEIKSIKIDGKVLDLSTAIRRQSSLMTVLLAQAFAPGSQHSIELEWNLPIPKERNIRMGTYHERNFMMAYWYPKINVYDDIYGWDRMAHTGNTEFYHEFGDYEVEITLPGSYIVLSSGVQTNEKEVFTSDFLKKMHAAYEQTQVVNLVQKNDLESKSFLKPDKEKTWKFKGNSLPDFAFMASTDYLWDACMVMSGTKPVKVNAVYHPESTDFHKVADVAAKSLHYFAEQSPKIEFPYPQMTAFNGDGGMEYPGMINDGDSEDLTATLFVTSHEIAHSYFPFATGLNEKLYAWMDEGLITFFPRKVIAQYTDDSSYVVFADLFRSYNRYAGSVQEIPLMVPSTNTGFAYRYQAYGRSSVAFYTLSEYLGAETFDRGLKLFYETWLGKHPTPYDFMNIFNQVAGEDLAWFWNPWLFDLGAADLQLAAPKGNTVEIVNKGGFPVPIKLKAIIDGKTHEFNIKASVWKARATYQIQLPKGKVEKLQLDTQLTADSNPADNLWENK